MIADVHGERKEEAPMCVIVFKGEFSSTPPNSGNAQKEGNILSGCLDADSEAFC